MQLVEDHRATSVVDGDAYKFAAFISYSHADKKIARRVKKSLENYRIPKGVIHRRFSGDQNSWNRIYPVFIDAERLRGGNLADQLFEHLDQAQALVVICSPASAKSDWVDREVQYFISKGRGRSIFPLLVRGEPNAALKGSPELECLPAALRVAAEAGDGAWKSETLAADARAGGGSVKVPVISIVAGIANLRLDLLLDAEVKRGRRRRLIVSAAVASVFAITCVAASESYRSYLDMQASLRAEYAIRTLSERTDMASSIEPLVGPEEWARFAVGKGQDSRCGAEIAACGIFDLKMQALRTFSFNQAPGGKELSSTEVIRTQDWLIDESRASWKPIAIPKMEATEQLGLKPAFIERRLSQMRNSESPFGHRHSIFVEQQVHGSGAEYLAFAAVTLETPEREVQRLLASAPLWLAILWAAHLALEGVVAVCRTVLKNRRSRFDNSGDAELSS